jgi:hypothetical protein
VTGNANWSCAEVLVAPGTSLEFNAPDTLRSTGPYIAEAKFTLGAASGSPWTVALNTGGGISCRFTTSGLPNPHLWVTRAQSCGWGGGSSGSSVSDTVGTVYIMQVFTLASNGYTYCRIRAADGTAVHHVSYSFSSFSGQCNEPVGVSTSNRSVTLDWFHAFRLN